VNDHGVERLFDAILADQRPNQFSATRDDVDVVRVALELRAAQAELVQPDRLFVEELQRRLAATGEDGGLLVPFPGDIDPPSEARVARVAGPRSRRNRTPGRHLGAAGKAAAAVLLMVSTVGITRVAQTTPRTAVAERAPAASAVHSGELITTDGGRLGQAYAYSGSSSWVLVDVRGAGLSGTYACDLRLVGGDRVRVGTIDVQNGTGYWAHTVRAAIDQMREVTLATTAGITVATATLS
jgi:hypothetical protein